MKTNLNNSDYWDKNIDYVMFIDENNSVSSLDIVKSKLLNKQEISPNENIFTVTGCIFDKKSYKELKKDFDLLRKKYWKNGQFKNKYDKLEYVCFHTEDIKSRKKAFHKSILSEEEYNNFIIDLDYVLKTANYQIISINIKIDDFLKYSTYKNMNLYNIAFNFIIERFIYNTPKKKKLGVIFEARGKNEDSLLLSHINNIINISGTEFVTAKDLQEKIKNISFNTKKNAHGYPYAGIEVADLSSYPIHRYVKFNSKRKDFETIETKIVGYPSELNKGFKIYPKK